MSLTPSNMLPLGTQASGFSLQDPVKGGEKSLDLLKSDKATVVMFICNHCPYVKHIQKVLVDVAKMYIAKGVSFIAINSNDADNYPEDSPEKMKEVSQRLGYPFSYLYDETQTVAKTYHAACTPDFYIFDKGLKLVYRGQFDDSRPGSGIPVNGEDLSSALENLLKGAPVSSDQKPSMGCNIKWK
jgi:thiol-disulfide isomerase/thioredoxin